MLATFATLPTMPRKKSDSAKKEPLTARVDPSLIAAMDALAEELEHSTSFMVEKAIKFFLAHRSDALPPAKPPKGAKR